MSKKQRSPLFDDVYDLPGVRVYELNGPEMRRGLRRFQRERQARTLARVLFVLAFLFIVVLVLFLGAL